MGGTSAATPFLFFKNLSIEVRFGGKTLKSVV